MASVVTYFVFRTGLGAVCLLAGLEKARAPRDFFEGVRQYRLVPGRLVPVVSGALIAAELGLGALLVSGLVPTVAAVGAIALFAVFAAALAVSLSSGSSSCGSATTRARSSPTRGSSAGRSRRTSPLSTPRAASS